MRSQQFNVPQLKAVSTQELKLSSASLLDLMQAVLSHNVPFRFCARGWSMTPFIRDGDVITIAPVNNVPAMGEIVAFVRPGTHNLVVHRVIANRGNGILIQGDNSLGHAEELVPAENILGRVIKIERNGKKVHIGLGLERMGIAWLSRVRLLTQLKIWLASWRKRLSNR